jgi:hypothetical protein
VVHTLLLSQATQNAFRHGQAFEAADMANMAGRASQSEQKSSGDESELLNAKSRMNPSAQPTKEMMGFHSEEADDGSKKNVVSGDAESRDISASNARAELKHNQQFNSQIPIKANRIISKVEKFRTNNSVGNKARSSNFEDEFDPESKGAQMAEADIRLQAMLVGNLKKSSD